MCPTTTTEDKAEEGGAEEEVRCSLMLQRSDTWVSHETRQSHCACLVYLLLQLITVHVSC